MLWDLKVISDHAPVTLQKAVFFYIGNDCYTYVENGSKNRSGVNTKETNKVVSVYASPIHSSTLLSLPVGPVFKQDASWIKGTGRVLPEACC